MRTYRSTLCFIAFYKNFKFCTMFLSFVRTRVNALNLLVLYMRTWSFMLCF